MTSGFHSYSDRIIFAFDFHELLHYMNQALFGCNWILSCKGLYTNQTMPSISISSLAAKGSDFIAMIYVFMHYIVHVTSTLLFIVTEQKKNGENYFLYNQLCSTGEDNTSHPLRYTPFLSIFPFVLFRIKCEAANSHIYTPGNCWACYIALPGTKFHPCFKVYFNFNVDTCPSHQF